MEILIRTHKFRAEVVMLVIVPTFF